MSLDSQPKRRRLLKILGKIRKRAGKVRGMDVLVGFASGVKPDGEQDCSVQLLEHLGTERRKKAKRLHVQIAEYTSTAR